MDPTTPLPSSHLLIPKFCGKETTAESMWHLISYVGRSLAWGRKRRARVADESVLEESAPDVAAVTGGRGGAVAALLALARAPLEVAACVAAVGRSEEDGAGQAARGDRLRPDEMSHLMVRDSMRYVIYV